MNKQKSTPSARDVALHALMAQRKSGIFLEDALDRELKRHERNPRDTGLASKLTFGTYQNRSLLDFYIGQFSSIPTQKLEPRVLDILRLAAYQIIFLDRIPNHAAIDEAVEQTKRGNLKAKGLVNAVSRRIAEHADSLPEVPRGDLAEYLSIQYSHPKWLVARFLDELGAEDTEALLQANNADTPIYAQVNTLNADTAQVIASLKTEGVEAERHPWLPDCLILKHTGSLTKCKAFRNGAIYIQDPAARLAVLVADPKPHMRVLDACAAPGGKSFAAGICMHNQGEIRAFDLSEKKLRRIEEGAERLGLTTIQTGVMDARELNPEEIGLFDIVIVDAPCSCLGIIRKKPESRDKKPEEIAGLPKIQLDILQSASKCVAPGGILLYATCTILVEENSGVMEAFLAQTKDFTSEAFTLSGNIGTIETGQVTLYPHIHDTDGFFISKLRRVT